MIQSKSGKTRADDKMATMSIAEELLNKINHIQYNSTVTALTIDHKLPKSVFQILKKQTKDKYTYSYERFSNNRGYPKPTGMFELFASYSGKDHQEVRENLTTYVEENKDDVLKVATDYFRTKHSNIGMWSIIMNRERTPGDELALYLLCKMHNRHAVVYHKTGTWSTMDPASIRPSAPLDEMSDITLIYQMNGFCEAIKVCDTDSNKTDKHVAPHSTKTTNQVKKTRVTTSISDLLKSADKKEQSSGTKSKPKQINKVSARLSEDNILPDGLRTRNTREPNPFRRRSSKRPLRDTHKNKNYSDNIDDNHLDSPKKKRRKFNVAGSLRTPSNTRQMAQKILTRRQLNQSAPPGTTRKLIGTYVKEEDKKPKVEMSEGEMREIEKRNKIENRKRQWPTDAKLVHIDGTLCSEECMRTSRYHQDVDDLQELNVATTVTEDPRNVRPMSSPKNSINKDTSTAELDGTTLEGSANINNACKSPMEGVTLSEPKENQLQDKNLEQVESQANQSELECVTTCNENTQEQNSQTDITTEVRVENQAKQTELECATTSTEDVPTINTNKNSMTLTIQ